MPEIVRGPSLLLTGGDCLYLAGPLNRHLADVRRRDGGVPPRLAAIAEQVALLASDYRATAHSSDIGTDRFRDDGPGALCFTSATWLTVEEAAQMLRLSPSYVRRLLRQRALAGVRSGSGRGAWMVDEAAAAEWRDEHRTTEAA